MALCVPAGLNSVLRLQARGVRQGHPPLLCSSRLHLVPYALQLLYVSTYPETSLLCTSFADNFKVTASDVRVEVAADALAEHAKDLTAWAQERGLQLSA